MTSNVSAATRARQAKYLRWIENRRRLSPGSITGRLRPEMLKDAAAHIERSAGYEAWSDDQIESSLHLYAKAKPHAVISPEEMAAKARAALIDEATRRIEISSPREAVADLSAMEKLMLSNTGKLPLRYELVANVSNVREMQEMMTPAERLRYQEDKSIPSRFKAMKN